MPTCRVEYKFYIKLNSINVNLGFRVHRLALMFYISLSLYLLSFLQLYIKLVNHSWPQDIEMVDIMQ